MPDFEKLTPELAHLYLRVDAARPTDPLLRAAADFWQEARGKSMSPEASLLSDFPVHIRSHAFLVRKTPNGTREWAFSQAGSSVSPLLGGEAGSVEGTVEPELAIRLGPLFDLVDQKGEPYAAMFELETAGRLRWLCEVYAAPLVTAQPGERLFLAIFNWREEAM